MEHTSDLHPAARRMREQRRRKTGHRTAVDAGTVLGAEKVYDFYEKGGVSCRLELDFADSPTPVIGSYGTRYYYDGTQLPSLLLSSEDWVCSFLAYE